MKKLSLLILISLAFGLLTASLNVIERGRDRLLVEFQADDYSLRELADYTVLQAKDMYVEAESGAPPLPHAEFKVSIPPGGYISVNQVKQDNQVIQLSKPLRPFPHVVEKDGIWIEEYHPDPALYIPSSKPVFEYLPESSFRGYSFVPVRINPFRYDGSLALNITKRLVLEIRILGNTGYRSTPLPDKHSEVILSNLINPEYAGSWQSSNRRSINFTDFSLSDWWIKIETDKDGMHRINRNQLNDLPLADIDPRSFRIFTTGGDLRPGTALQEGAELREVPILVTGEEDGSFDSGDYIVFYGASRNGTDKNQVVGTNHYYNPYSKTTVYWLSFGNAFQGSPLRINAAPLYDSWDQETSTFTDTYRLEEERHRRDVHGFDWYMGRFFGYNTADYSYNVDLPDLDESQPQNLRFEIVQELINSFITHRVSVFVNGEPVVRDTLTGSTIFEWPNVTTYGFERNVNLFQPGSNNITLRLHRDRTLNYFFDYIRIKYSRLINKGSGQYSIFTNDALRRVRYNIGGDHSSLLAYMVDSQYDVEQLTLQDGGSFLIAQGISGSRIQLLRENEYYNPVSISLAQPTNLAINPGQTDNIIISPSGFMQQAEELVGIYRDVYGLSSRIVDQQDIFDQFNGGHPDPVAIRQFLRFAYHNWGDSFSPKISSLTLLGLGTIDWVNTSGLAASKNKVILYQKTSSTNPLSDDWYGMLTNETYPELAIGRYPARNSAELGRMISNFRDYSQNPQPGWWRNSVVLLADDLYNGPNSPYEDIHTEQVQDAAEAMHHSVFADKIFAWEYPYDEFQNKPGARDDLVKSLNDGRLAWIYIGHGSADNLGTEEYFNGATDIGRLSNSGKLPFFVAMSCKVSNFDHWAFDSLGEKIVLQQDAGAIASWSATRISFSPQNGAILDLLLDRLINQRQYLGQAIMNSKLAYTSDSYNEAVYVLLGDPHVRSYPPSRYPGIEPEYIDDTDTLYSRQLVNYQGSFDSTYQLQGIAQVKAYDTDREYNLDAVPVSQSGDTFFDGGVSLSNKSFSGSFIVPDDIRSGDTASIIAYFRDEARNEDYISYNSPLKLSSQALPVSNDAAPQIEIFLSTLDFRPGDTVNESPLLLARISDDNGINITGNAGRNIVLVLDGSIQPIPITQYFSYDLDSHTTGMLRYQMPKLSEGTHTVQIIAFDSFNLPSVASTHFEVKKLGPFNLERFLIYPNPMQDDASFTFILSETADLQISIYTMRGRRIRKIEALGREGFNDIRWDGRDSAGDRLANNTYFVKVKATNASGKTIEKTERIVIYN